MIELELMRIKIDEIDDKLLVLFKERLEVSKKIGLLKKKHNIKIFDPQREQEIIDNCTQNVSEDEKEYYGIGWGPNMDKLVSSGTAHKITDIHYSDRFGWFGCIDGYNFQLYHIESVSNFDLI